MVGKGREGTESIRTECGDWEHRGHGRAGEEEEGRGHKFCAGKSYWRKHLGFSFHMWIFHKKNPKTVQETQIWASSVLLLPKLLFLIFLLNVGVLLDLLSLISYLRSTRLAGRHLEEWGIDSQMARQERQIRAPVDGRDVLEGSVSSGHLSLSQGSAPKALNKV